MLSLLEHKWLLRTIEHGLLNVDFNCDTLHASVELFPSNTLLEPLLSNTSRMSFTPGYCANGLLCFNNELLEIVAMWNVLEFHHHHHPRISSRRKS